MLFYASPAAEAVAVRRAVARAGCVARTVKVQPARIGEPVRVVGQIGCPDGWGAARLLLALAIEDSLTPGAIRIAEDLRRGASSDDDFARAVQTLVKTRVHFERESTEEFESGGYTLEIGKGDCDAHFRLAYGIAAAGGLHAALGILHHGKNAPPDKQGPAHAVAVFELDGRWEWAESTVNAEFGEPPNDAARRLGLTNERTDIAREVMIMTESDLAPLPPNFRDHNDPSQVALDAEALQRLGYLAADAPACLLSDPTASVLRLAVVDFQRAHALKIDGLLGPTTRLTIAKALREAGPPITEGFDYPGIGGLDEAAEVIVVKTKHLSPGFFRGVVGMAQRMRTGGATITAEDLLAVWMAESGIRNIPNRQGYPYAGLNQMGPQERKSAGFQGTMTDWLALSCEDQLPYVERFYVGATGGHFQVLRDAASLYLVNFLPAYIGHAGEPDYVLAKRNTDGPEPTSGEDQWKPWREAHKGDWYAANRGFDSRKDGTIRVKDLGTAVAGAKNSDKVYWSEVVARLEAEGGAPAPLTGRRIAGIGVVVAMLGVGAWAAYQAATS